MCTWQHRDVYDVQSRQKNSQYWINYGSASETLGHNWNQCREILMQRRPQDLASCQADDCVQAPLSQHDPIKSRLRHSWAVMWHVGTILDVHRPRVDRCNRFLPRGIANPFLPAVTFNTIKILNVYNTPPQNICMIFIQRRPNVFNVSSTLYKSNLYKCFCLLGR